MFEELPGHWECAVRVWVEVADLTLKVFVSWPRRLLLSVF